MLVANYLILENYLLFHLCHLIIINKKIDDLISQLSAGNGAGVNTQAEEAALKDAKDKLDEVDEKIKNNNIETLKRIVEFKNRI